MSNYIKKSTCRVCNSHELQEVLNLKKQPLANSYHHGEELLEFPLSLNLCTECFHLQLGVVVNPDLMFKDYLYVSGTSKTLHEYFEGFVDICSTFVCAENSVLDIACNDGTQLDKFKERGWKTYGVDPAENLHPLSSRNHNVLCDYWTTETAAHLGGTYDLLIAQNVFAHVDDVHEFLAACSLVMSDESRLLIQTSQADMIVNNEFDTIYHEHLSFFSAQSMKRCANLNNFSLIDVFTTDIHGGSYVFVLAKGSHDESLAQRRITAEESRGLYKTSTYELYRDKCHKVASDLVTCLDSFRTSGHKVVGYGAAAKGNTFLNFSSLDLDYIVDDNELKWDLYTPGRNISICSPDALAAEDPSKLVIVPLAWNFFKEIQAKVLSRMEGGSSPTFVKYFPEIDLS